MKATIRTGTTSTVVAVLGSAEGELATFRGKVALVVPGEEFIRFSEMKWDRFHAVFWSRSVGFLAKGTLRPERCGRG